MLMQNRGDKLLCYLIASPFNQSNWVPRKKLHNCKKLDSNLLSLDHESTMRPLDHNCGPNLESHARGCLNLNFFEEIT